MSNNGFVDVSTQPAGAHSLSVPGLGLFTPGAGPTIGSDGTVVLATREGRVVALHPDGSAYWNRELPAGAPQEMIASAAIGSDQSAYVVGVSSDTTRTHGDNNSVTTSANFHATLYRFTAGGGAPPGNATPFPEPPHPPSPGIYGPRFTGAPAVWQFGADEAVIVPAAYATHGGEELHLLAFAPSGGLMADVLVARWRSDVSGDSGIDWSAILGHFGPKVTIPPHPPLPGIGIAANPQGGTPFITVVNRYQNEVVGYTFCVGSACSPAPGFTERFRTQHHPRALWSSPITLPDLHTAVGTDQGLVFTGPNATVAPPIDNLGGVYATPAVAADGTVVLVTMYGDVVKVRDQTVVARITLSAPSTAGAIASRTNVFVSTRDGFYTLDAAAQTKLFQFPWDGGGLWPPAIGPDGRVYAIASNVLFIFPPPPIAGGVIAHFVGTTS